MAEKRLATREIKFLFEGLFFFCFSEPRAGEDPNKRSAGYVGILSVDPKHDLDITFTDENGERKITLHHSAVRGLPKEITIEKATAAQNSASAGVLIEGGWQRPKDALTASASGHLPFGLIADFEGKDMHGKDYGGAIPKKPGRLHPGLLFTTGTFYTEKPSKNTYSIVRKRADERSGSSCTSYRRDH